jgi:hypothetical protein
MNIQKEGRVYTPEHMANYIAKTTIEKFLLEKINTKFSTELSNLNDLFEKNYKERSDREQLEYIFEVINSLKVLDPAVGS